MGKIWMFASGKGGVGKSTLAAALAVTCARRGLLTALLDGDIGLRSLDLMMGMQDRMLYELSDCARRRCSMDEALTPHPDHPRLRLIMGGQAARPKDFAARDIAKMLKTLRNRHDILLIDAPAGIGRGLKLFADAADELVLVATPDAVCLRDTEKTGQLLWERTEKHPWLLMNRYEPRLLRQGLVDQPSAVAAALDHSLLGVVPEDPKAYEGMLRGRTLAEEGSRRVKAALERIAGRMLGETVPLPRVGGRLFGLRPGRLPDAEAGS